MVFWEPKPYVSERAMCEAVKPKVQWRSQEIGEARHCRQRAETPQRLATRAATSKAIGVRGCPKPLRALISPQHALVLDTEPQGLVFSLLGFSLAVVHFLFIPHSSF